MKIRDVREIDSGKYGVLVARAEAPSEFRQGDKVLSDGRRWTLLGLNKNLFAPEEGLCLVLERKGTCGCPRIGAEMTFLGDLETGGDAIWLSREQARLVGHILRTVRIWRTEEACAGKHASPGLRLLAEHDEEFEKIPEGERLLAQLVAVGSE